MKDERLEKINFITGVFSGCLWEFEENGLDELYKQAVIFHNKKAQKAREFAHELIEKLFVDK